MKSLLLGLMILAPMAVHGESRSGKQGKTIIPGSAIKIVLDDWRPSPHTYTPARETKLSPADWAFGTLTQKQLKNAYLGTSRR